MDKVDYASCVRVPDGPSPTYAAKPRSRPPPAGKNPLYIKPHERQETPAQARQAAGCRGRAAPKGKSRLALQGSRLSLTGEANGTRTRNLRIDSPAL